MSQMSRHKDRTVATAQPWLLLSYQLPAKPAYARVKIWRRLQSIGAVAVKNSVYALPPGEQAQEDFEWLLKEVQDQGGEGLICEAKLVGGLSDQEIEELFRRTRDADYEELAKEARALAISLDPLPVAQQRIEGEPQLKRLKARRDHIVAIDFFGANGRDAVDGLLAGVEERLREEAVAEPQVSEQEQGGPMTLTDLRGRTWVTRKGVHVDRIASAWLIRRFIDPEARFRFVPAKGYVPNTGELRFDMFEAEFTHEGDRCTFEVLLSRTGLSDPALSAIGEIVHDIDLKDEKFGREEAAGIRTLVAGICAPDRGDDERIARGSAVFDDLYEYFRKKRG
jgi:hypothetical protein